MSLERRAALARAAPILRAGPAFALLAVALFAVNSAGAALPSASTTLLAPYKGSSYTVIETVSPTSPGACTAARLPTQAYWHSKTGTAGIAAAASVRSSKVCTGPYTMSYYTGVVATANSELWVSIPLGHPKSAGYHTVVVNWTTDFQFRWNISHAGCPRVNLSAKIYSTECLAEVSIAAGPNVGYTYYDPELVDTTQGNVQGTGYPNLPSLGNTSEWERYESCSTATSCSWTNVTAGPLRGNLTGSLASNSTFRGMTFNVSHTYALQFFVDAMVKITLLTTVRGWLASASARADLGTGANGVVVRSITLS